MIPKYNKTEFSEFLQFENTPLNNNALPHYGARVNVLGCKNTCEGASEKLNYIKHAF